MLMNEQQKRNKASIIIKELLDLEWLNNLSQEKKLYDRIILQKMVGRGGEGKVYKTNAIDEVVYAVKVMEVNPNNTTFLKYVEKVIKEFKCIIKLDCRYLVK